MRHLALVLASFFVVSAAFANNEFRGELLTWREFSMLPKAKRLNYLAQLSELLIIMEKKQQEMEVASYADSNSLQELKEYIAVLKRELSLLPEAEAQTRRQEKTAACDQFGSTYVYDYQAGVCVDTRRGGLNKASCVGSAILIRSGSSSICVPREEWSSLKREQQTNLARKGNVDGRVVQVSNPSSSSGRVEPAPGVRPASDTLKVGQKELRPGDISEAEFDKQKPTIQGPLNGKVIGPGIVSNDPEEKKEESRLDKFAGSGEQVKGSEGRLAPPPVTPTIINPDAIKGFEITCDSPSTDGLKKRECKKLSNKQRADLLRRWNSDDNLCIFGGHFSEYKKGRKKVGNCKPIEKFSLGSKSATCKQAGADGSVPCNPMLFCLGYVDEKGKVGQHDAALKKGSGTFHHRFLCADKVNQDITKQCKQKYDEYLSGKRKWTATEKVEGKEFKQEFKVQKCDPADVNFPNDKDAANQWNELREKTESRYQKMCLNDSEFQALFCQECKDMTELVLKMNMEARGTACPTGTASSPAGGKNSKQVR